VTAARSHVYTYPSKKALLAVCDKVRTISRQGRNDSLTDLLPRLNPVLRGWCNYFRHGVSKATFQYLSAFAWRGVTVWLRRKHPRANWKWLRRHYLPGWWPTEGEATMFNPSTVPVTRYRYRGYNIPSPVGRTSSRDRRMIHRLGLVESRMRGDAHVRFGGRTEETDWLKGWHRASVRPCAQSDKKGSGLEVVITFRTGFGRALFMDGRLMPHLESAHQPFRNDET
jgi:hypothetical protein